MGRRCYKPWHRPSSYSAYRWTPHQSLTRCFPPQIQDCRQWNGWCSIPIQGEGNLCNCHCNLEGTHSSHCRAQIKKAITHTHTHIQKQDSAKKLQHTTYEGRVVTKHKVCKVTRISVQHTHTHTHTHLLQCKKKQHHFSLYIAFI